VERGAGGATGVLRDSTFRFDFSRDFGAAFGARFAFKRLDLGRVMCRLAAFFTALVFDLGLVAMIRGSSAKTAELIKVVALKVKLTGWVHLAGQLL
jgi:hypothetical protein